MLSEQGRTRGEGSDTQGGRACVLKGSREPRVEGRRKTKGRLDVLPLPPASSGYFCLPETFLLFKKPIIMDHKRKAVLRLTLCGSVYTGVLRAGTGWATTCSNTNQSSFSARSPLPSSWGFGRLLVFTVLWEALGTSLRSHRWKPEVGGMGAGLPRQSKRDPTPCPESAKAPLFMFRLDHPLRILLNGGFHGWKRFEKSQLYLNSVSAKAKWKCIPSLEKHPSVNKCALHLTTQPLLSVNFADCGRTFLGPAVLCCSLDNPLSRPAKTTTNHQTTTGPPAPSPRCPSRRKVRQFSSHRGSPGGIHPLCHQEVTNSSPFGTLKAERAKNQCLCSADESSPTLQPQGL